MMMVIVMTKMWMIVIMISQITHLPSLEVFDQSKNFINMSLLSSYMPSLKVLTSAALKISIEGSDAVLSLLSIVN